jgi:hypothetical protein
MPLAYLLVRLLFIKLSAATLSLTIPLHSP